MRQTHRSRSEEAGLFALGARIGPHEVRRLFVRFCREVERFSDGLEIEVSPFELFLREASSGFSVVVSPLSELFIVSIGESRSCDVRVSSVESFVSALDLTLVRYLAAASKAFPPA